MLRLNILMIIEVSWSRETPLIMSLKRVKSALAIAGKKGGLVKQFRCRDGIVGNTEYFISHGNNCSLDCEYCFLQCYFDNGGTHCVYKS